jgi:hypothetical protein
LFEVLRAVVRTQRDGHRKRHAYRRRRFLTFVMTTRAPPLRR